ncbi:polysaccharide lyase 6 family protein [Algoriphagus chordae]|uniref:Poly(Beta-D-mannuronate) lyase n=1 Tax=Algoriphagus chordae TaxID=237019 RepID=A0A2W7QPA8_9BACT|nr:polysaccharide lyase 6 family protein [Algoriphagus chordae]PZX49821.1 poly(beta-D-mannuronate) lyase [Algoriphagus chordae]
MTKLVQTLKHFYGIALVCLLPMACQSQPNHKIVKNIDEYNSTISTLKAGDTLLLANGVWKDAELIFEGKGTADSLIVLMAETPGEVFLEGKSNLSIAGEYLVVNGLVFRNGFTPSGEVISFRTDSKNLAFHSRVTACVIDNFNNPDRNAQDSWVMMYGQNNRFDHNHLEGKRNQGVTMAVRLNSEDSQTNHHSIDHNYFGPRPVLGSNGGETLRVGTSQYSLTNSNTVIENNYFDNCNGETEIISIKSGGNIIRGNVFFESKGSLTLRHGNGNTVEENIFLGNGKPETGGIRVINADHKIINNYLQGLDGDKFRAGISIMNGVPNSSINRYHQVKNITIANNTFVNVAHIELAVGSDQERSAIPEGSVFKDNLIYNEKQADIFKAYDDISGIAFSDNISNINSTLIGNGLNVQKLTLEKAANGLQYPAGINAGAPHDLKVIDKSDTGVTWYPKVSKEMVFSTGEQIPVSPGLNSISDALANAKSGDVLLLQAGSYQQNKVLDVLFPLTVKSDGDAIISFEGTHLFEIYDGGALNLEGINVSGANAADAAGNAVIRINRSGTLKNYKLKVSNSQFSDMTVNHSFNFLEASKGSFADTVSISNSSFENFTGSILTLDKETDDLGKYNAEYVIVEGNQFSNIGGKVADVYRGGTDESTFGPYVLVHNNQVTEVGKNSRNLEKASFNLLGAQWVDFSNNKFSSSAPIQITETVGTPVTILSENELEKTAPINHAKN